MGASYHKGATLFAVCGFASGRKFYCLYVLIQKVASGQGIKTIKHKAPAFFYELKDVSAFVFMRCLICVS